MVGLHSKVTTGLFTFAVISIYSKWMHVKEWNLIYNATHP